eukprot:1145932-Pelagomonas_calceolata.AAC.1
MVLLACPALNSAALSCLYFQSHWVASVPGVYGAMLFAIYRLSTTDVAPYSFWNFKFQAPELVRVVIKKPELRHDLRGGRGGNREQLTPATDTPPTSKVRHPSQL